MAKDYKIIELFDIYKGLLTDNQREIFSSYYLFDLSLSEIAEPLNKTRQSVSEMIKAVETKLYEFETALKLNQKFKDVLDLTEPYGELKEKIKDILS